MVSRFIEAAGVAPYWLAVAALGVAAVSYFLGCFNGSVVVSRYILRDDVRDHGSGNAGLTNFYRTFGGPLTAVVILSDVIKAVLAVLFGVYLARQISPELVVLAKYWAGAFCLLGHMYPCTFQFRGGKGILSGGTIVIMIDWRIAVVAWVAFLVLVILTRYVSLGSCAAALTFPITSAVIYHDTLITVLAAFLGGLVIWKHRMNLVRLVAGTESKFTLHKKKPAPEPAEDTQAEAEAPVEKTVAETQAEETAAEGESVPGQETPAEEPSEIEPAVDEPSDTSTEGQEDEA